MIPVTSRVDRTADRLESGIRLLVKEAWVVGDTDVADDTEGRL